MRFTSALLLVVPLLAACVTETPKPVEPLSNPFSEPAPVLTPLVAAKVDMRLGAVLKAVEVVDVPTNVPQPTYSRATLAAGQPYLVEASGVFSSWKGHADGSDAAYVYGSFRVTEPEVRQQLLLDDRSIMWLARQAGDDLGYDPGHVYRIAVIGAGRPLKLQVASAKLGKWSENSGSLRVTISPVGTPP